MAGFLSQAAYMAGVLRESVERERQVHKTGLVIKRRAINEHRLRRLALRKPGGSSCHLVAWGVSTAAEERRGGGQQARCLRQTIGDAGALSEISPDKGRTVRAPHGSIAERVIYNAGSLLVFSAPLARQLSTISRREFSRRVRGGSAPCRACTSICVLLLLLNAGPNEGFQFWPQELRFRSFIRQPGGLTQFMLGLEDIPAGVNLGVTYGY